MKGFGWILVALGGLDYGLSLIGFDITGIAISPMIFGGVGFMFIMYSDWWYIRKSSAELDQEFDSSGVVVVLNSVWQTSFCYLTETSIIYENTLYPNVQWPMSRYAIYKYAPSDRVEIDLDEIESVSKLTAFRIPQGILLNLKDGSKQAFYIRRKLIGEFIEQIGQRLG